MLRIAGCVCFVPVTVSWSRSLSLTSIAIEKNRVTTVALIVVFFLGIQAFLNLPRAEDPGFIIRAAQVITYFPGASPVRMEQLVTDKLEKAIQEMPEIDFIQSESKTGVSILIVNILESYREMRPIWDKLRRKLGDAQPDLPDGILGPFVNDEFGDVFGTIVTLTGEGYSYAELKEIADDVRDEILLIPEVAKVEIYGAQEERVFVEYNNAQLSELGVSPFQLQQLLESQNIIFSGGDVRTPYEEIVLEPSGNFESVEELRGTVIRLPGATISCTWEMWPTSIVATSIPRARRCTPAGSGDSPLRSACGKAAISPCWVTSCRRSLPISRVCIRMVSRSISSPSSPTT